MIRALGHRLQALHIHDNDRWHDSHQIPFSMSIDFAPIAAALKEIGYKGWFTLEADHYLKEKFNAENVFEGMKDLHTAAVRFEKLFLSLIHISPTAAISFPHTPCLSF